MTIRLRTIFFLFLGIIVLSFLYVERAILSPFVAAAIFAYIFNPIVNFFSEKAKLPRLISVVIIYLLLIALIAVIGTIITQRVLSESTEIRSYVTTLLHTARSQIDSLPDFVRPTVYDFLDSIEKSKLYGSSSLLPFFPKALERLIGFLIFAFSGFYFLREGGEFVNRFLTIVPRTYKIDVEILIRKINAVLGSYLRGQVFLVFLLSMVTLMALSILGIRFALLIAIFSGFAEIVPIFGPIVAASIAVLVAIVTGSNNFGLPQANVAIVIICVYFVLRHIEDYFVVPQVMGKITKLPPFIIFFSVIAGGHVWGILGLILAVPVAAIIKLLLEFSMDHINGKRNVLGSE